MSRWIIAAVTVASAFPVLAGESAFLVIDAVVHPPSQRQPTWIALVPEEGGVIHVSTGDAIVELSPGSYRIDHIDFGASSATGQGTIDLDIEPLYRFDLRAGSIGYFGLIQLERHFERLGQRYGYLRVRLIPSVELIQKACQRSPDTFRK